MFQESAPRGFVTGEYLQYQERYSKSPRESDKMLITLIEEVVTKHFAGQRLALLDVGCSRGNLLNLIRTALPNMDYFGCDLFPEIIDRCQQDPELSGIRFEAMDVRDLKGQDRFDIIVASAVIYRFPDDEFNLAVSSIGRVLKRGGWFFAFEFCHPFEQEIFAIEKSIEHPEGLSLNFRPYSKVARILEAHGFEGVQFRPFSIPIDLVKPSDPSDTRTYTVRTTEGERLNFRGCLFLPWCHWSAQKQ